MSKALLQQSYQDRAQAHPSQLARRLLSIMAAKGTNLCVSVDVTSKASLLRIADAVGPYCCIIKTHIDIVLDFDEDLTQQLKALSAKHNFLLFEDRKFADIGNTVKLQYSSGVYKISSWADIVNAHALPGPGIITGLRSVVSSPDHPERGLLLIAELSSKGSMAKGSYTEATVTLAQEHKDFVFGFIAQSRVDKDIPEDFLIMTPGIGLEAKGDSMDQQYRTPEQVVVNDGADVIIVGRGIYGSGEGHETGKIVEEARRYKEAGWAAYLKRLQQS